MHDRILWNGIKEDGGHGPAASIIEIKERAGAREGELWEHREAALR